MNDSSTIKVLADHGITCTVTPVELSAQERQDQGDCGQNVTIAFRSGDVAMDLPGYGPGGFLDVDRAVSRAVGDIYAWIITDDYEHWCEMYDLDPSADSSRARAKVTELNSRNWMEFVRRSTADTEPFHRAVVPAVFADIL